MLEIFQVKRTKNRNENESSLKKTKGMEFSVCSFSGIFLRINILDKMKLRS